MGRWLEGRDRAERIGLAVPALIVFLATAGPLLTSIVVSPEAIERGAVTLSPPCETLARTGVECMTCGLTRGFCAMSRLRLGDALAYNAATPWLYLGAWLLALVSGAALVMIAAPRGTAASTGSRGSLRA